MEEYKDGRTKVQDKVGWHGWAEEFAGALHDGDGGVGDEGVDVGSSRVAFLDGDELVGDPVYHGES